MMMTLTNQILAYNQTRPCRYRLPASYAINYPQQHWLRVTDPDTLVSGFVRYEEHGETVWEKFLDEPTVRFDTTWTPTPSKDGVARVVFELTDAHPESPETVREEYAIELLPSTWQERVIDVVDFFSGEPVFSGYVTFPGGQTIDVTDGKLEIKPMHKIDKDSVDQGLYRILFEKDRYLTYSSKVQTDQPLRVIPEEHIEAAENNWTWEKQLPYLQPFNWSAEPDNRVTHRWPHDAVIDVYLYDQSILEPCDGPGACFVKSDDENLLASEFYIQTSKEVHEELEGLLRQAGSDITIRTHLESVSDKEFPRRTREPNAIQIAGDPGAPFGITHATRTNEGELYWAFMLQQTDAENGPRFVTTSTIRSDSIESFGLNTTQGGRFTIIYGTGEIPTPENPEHYKQPVVNRMLEFFYQHPSLTGKRVNMHLPNKDGGFTDAVDIYVPVND